MKRVEAVKARLAKGAGSAFAINVTASALALGAHVLLARLLGPQGYGIYAYVLAWVTVLALLGTLGFHIALLRFVAGYLERGDWGLARGVIRYADRRVGATALAIAAAGMAVIGAFHERFEPQLWQTFLVGFAMLPALALLQVRASALRAFGRIVAALAPRELLGNATTILVLGGAALGFSLAIQAWFAMAVSLFGATLGLALVSMSLHRARREVPQTASVAEARREWRRAMLPLLFLAGGHIVNQRIGVLMLGWLADTQAAGVFAVASRMSDLIVFPLTAVNMIFAPTISALHARSDTASLQAMVTATARWSTLSALVIAVPLLLFAEPVLRLFGAAFAAGTGVLRILAVAQVVSAAAGSVGFLLTMTGREWGAAWVIGAALAGQALLGMLLIPIAGSQGAAVAYFVAVIAWNLAMALLVWQHLKIVPGVTSAFRTGR